MLKLKLRIPTEDRVALIKMFYDLVTQPDMQPNLVDAFGLVLRSLLKKQWELKDAGIQLDWKPLWNLMKEVYIPKTRDRMLQGAANCYNNLAHVGLRARE